jgi:hypothetical protein
MIEKKWRCQTKKGERKMVLFEKGTFRTKGRYSGLIWKKLFIRLLVIKPASGHSASVTQRIKEFGQKPVT